MVQRTLGRQIVAAVAVALVVTLIAGKKPQQTNVYNASFEASDILTLSGIREADAVKGSERGSKAVVVPHHIVSSKLIAQGVRSILPRHPKAVVVLSPDHFGKCPTALCTTNGEYKTLFGNATIDKKSVKALLSHREIVSESELFADEHGVYAVVPFIKHYLPNAAVVPVVISQKTRGDEALRSEIADAVGELVKRDDVALVVSSDFSHYLTLSEANKKDELTQNAICEGDVSALATLNNPDQSDCPLCLVTLALIGRANNFWHPNILGHTNSATLLNDLKVPQTTSHYAISFVQNSEAGNCPVVK